MWFYALLTGLAAGFGFASWRLLQRNAVDPRLWSTVTAALLLSVGIAASKLDDNVSTASVSAISPRTTGALASLPLESLAWPPTLTTQVTRPGAAPTLTEAAPVASLITRLETRLAEQADDVKGWVLLAQSYAFTGNDEAAEHAVRRAVALGFDEQALRERVQLARREAQPVNWIEQAIGG